MKCSGFELTVPLRGVSKAFARLHLIFAASGTIVVDKVVSSLFFPAEDTGSQK